MVDDMWEVVGDPQSLSPTAWHGWQEVVGCDQGRDQSWVVVYRADKGLREWVEVGGGW